MFQEQSATSLTVQIDCEFRSKTPRSREALEKNLYLHNLFQPSRDGESHTGAWEVGAGATTGRTS